MNSTKSFFLGDIYFIPNKALKCFEKYLLLILHKAPMRATRHGDTFH